MAADEQPKDQKNLHVLFFPLFAHGHMIPLFDIARLFAAQDRVQVTVVTTPINAPIFLSATDKEISDKSAPLTNIKMEIFSFPAEEVGLPPGIENADCIVDDDEILLKFFKAYELLRDPLTRLMDRLKPSCIVSDLLLTWTSEVANQFGIPRLGFHGSNFFSMSAMEVMLKRSPQKAVSSDDEEFVIPGLPDRITLTRTQLSPEVHQEDLKKLFQSAYKAERNTLGIVMNSFYELESNYANYYRQTMGKRAWTVGPVSLYNRSITDKANRGKKGATDEQEYLKWLDTKPPNSVIYVSFGSVTFMSSAQLRQIAVALEALEQNFIWVVRTINNSNTEQDQLEDGKTAEDWLPDPEYEKRNQGKGLIIRGWAPQVLILDHQATGAFLTHCGWNSILEALAAGLPMVTWPLFAEQFLNEKLVTQIIKTGVPVGSKKFWNRVVKEVSVEAEAIKKAIEKVMAGNEALEMRKKALAMKEKASMAVQTGGSSNQGLKDLLSVLRSY